ncbi:hypothetical protein BT69DRAFT_590705 [Atractiella rhizophila]|nr:hypothetical protein BT69DRAFT_590705 [Atractiella rhizophila]
MLSLEDAETHFNEVGEATVAEEEELPEEVTVEGELSKEEVGKMLSPKKRRKPRCSECHRSGHNKRGCPRLRAASNSSHVSA